MSGTGKSTEGQQNMGNGIITKVKAYARKECANYYKGQCLPRDRDCWLVKPERKVPNCHYFFIAVLPGNKTLEAAYYQAIRGGESGNTLTTCQDCGKGFTKNSNRQTRCEICANRRRHRLDATRKRNKRAEGGTSAFRTEKGQ